MCEAERIGPRSSAASAPARSLLRAEEVGDHLVEQLGHRLGPIASQSAAKIAGVDHRPGVVPAARRRRLGGAPAARERAPRARAAAPRRW